MNEIRIGVEESAGVLVRAGYELLEAIIYGLFMVLLARRLEPGPSKAKSPEPSPAT